MDNPSVFDHLGPFRAHLDSFGPFQAKNDFLLRSTSVKPYFVYLGQKIHVCLKWSRRGHMGPKCSKWSTTLGLSILLPLRPFWTTLERV